MAKQLSSDVLSLYKAEHQIVRLSALLGGNLLATLLGVSRSRISPWKSGRGKVPIENQRKISDLDYVMSRLLIELYPDQVLQWLQGSNAHLNFARPMDAFLANGPFELLEAIDALSTGSYA